jgi:hypothetical protein
VSDTLLRHPERAGRVEGSALPESKGEQGESKRVRLLETFQGV